MKTQFVRRSVSFLVIALLIVGLWLGGATPVQAYASVLKVAAGSGCTGISNCFPTIQAAVDAAAAEADPPVEIRVAEGTYTDIHSQVLPSGTIKQIVYITKNVVIRGGYNSTFSGHNPLTHVTTLDAQGNGRVIYIAGDISPTIADLSITGGNATGLGGYTYPSPMVFDAGGGVYINTANATLTNNLIYNNTSPAEGGGVVVENSTSQLSGNSIHDNSIVTGGGGGVFLYNSAATLGGNKIYSNTSGNVGAGLYMFGSDAMILNNTISDNTANGLGGGFDIASCNPTLSGNVISGNKGHQGGGGYIWYSSSILTNNVIIENQAVTTGSGIEIGASTPQLLHTTIAHNTGGDGSGIYATDDGNPVAGKSTVTMKNSIVANQTVGIFATSGSTVTMDGVLWYGNTPNKSGSGLTMHGYTGNPRFEADGYHLMENSAAINKGVSAGVTTDIDGEARLGTPDLGADEYPFNWIFLPLVKR